MIRFRIAAIATVTMLVLASPVAFGKFTFRPPVDKNSHADDEKTCWGDGNDACISWETADADQHYMSIEVPASSASTESGCVIIHADADLDRGLSCDDGSGNTRPELLVCSNDQTDPDECFFIMHNNVRSVIGNKDPTQQILIRGNAIWAGEGDKSEGTLGINVSASGSGRFSLREGTGFNFDGNLVNYSGSSGKQQWAMETADNTGNQIVIASGSTGIGSDYCHSAQTDPTLFIHSDTAPTTGPCAAAEWGSFYHDKDDFFIETGKGDVIVDATGGDFFIKASGTSIGSLGNDSGNLKISSIVSDGDIKFAGSDGGVAVTALTLDMSAAGAATFSATATFSKGMNLAVVKTFADNTTGESFDAGPGIYISTFDDSSSAANKVLTLPASPTVGDQYILIDTGGVLSPGFGGNEITLDITRAGSDVIGTSGNSTANSVSMNKKYGTAHLIYAKTGLWIIINKAAT